MGKKIVLLVVGYLLIVVMAGCGGHGKPAASTSTLATPQSRQITTTQATTIPSPATHNQSSAQPALDAVDFVSDTVGYVGGQGIILKSSDGGLTWVKLYASPDNVVSVDAVDAVNVWAATSNYLCSDSGRC
jgi:photosystem II stability/assembly factor-like uncharacterized protein